jgi:phosphoribosylformylglycinamidine (FGAM) synthase-like enzyme
MDIGSGILQHVRVVSNHVTRINWNSQLELYDLVHRCLQEQIITDLRPIMWGGIAEVLLEMGLWSGIGVQLKPALSTIELFSAAPGRFLVGVLPQEAKKFEALIKGEWLTPVGTTGGEKLFGLPLERYREERGAKVSP